MTEYRERWSAGDTDNIDSSGQRQFTDSIYGNGETIDRDDETEGDDKTVGDVTWNEMFETYKESTD